MGQIISETRNRFFSSHRVERSCLLRGPWETGAAYRRSANESSNILHNQRPRVGIRRLGNVDVGKRPGATSV